MAPTCFYADQPPPPRYQILAISVSNAGFGPPFFSRTFLESPRKGRKKGGKSRTQDPGHPSGQRQRVTFRQVSPGGGKGRGEGRGLANHKAARSSKEAAHGSLGNKEDAVQSARMRSEGG
ncbi:hypothetical protein KM043_004548 [Ampulex compressa]|nr:hypothetical protein KM043_004548 [Ampulex compressa]